MVLHDNRVDASPILKLSFEESLNVDHFIDELRDYSLKNVNEIFKEIYDIKNAAAKSFRLIEKVKAAVNPDKITWELSEQGKALLKKKNVEWARQNETGKLLPRILNQTGGKAGKMLKGVDANKIAQLTKLATIAVSAAHIISGADQVRELNLLDRKIDYLLAARKIDQLSKLESNFYLAKELLATAPDEMNKSKILDLHREVIEMRTNWRNEIEQKLKHIEDPGSKSFFDTFFTSRKSRDKQVYSELSQFEEEIALIDFSLIYDIALCESIGHINSSLKTEINRLEKTKNLLREKAKYLSGSKAKEKQKLDIQIDQFDRIINRYKKFLPASGSA